MRDFARQDTALDVLTSQNFYGAYLTAEGTRYDSVVLVNPDASGSGGTAGPATGFNLGGSSATAPTMVQPIHTSTVSAGNVFLGWTPVSGATLYEYYVGSGTSEVRGVTPGLLVQVPLVATGSVWNGVARACPAGATCVAGSETGWGPWSNAPGGPGITQFTVVGTGLDTFAFRLPAGSQSSVVVGPLDAKNGPLTAQLLYHGIMHRGLFHQSG